MDICPSGVPVTFFELMKDSSRLMKNNIRCCLFRFYAPFPSRSIYKLTLNCSDKQKGSVHLARKKRIWFPGAKYHLTGRGIRRMPLFHDEEDRLEYLRLLKYTKAKMPFHLQSYCLMTNHVHLQVETLDYPPGDIIKYLHSNYAKYFNKKYEFGGHLFESRYGSVLLDSKAQELDTHRYIHLNPLRAAIVKDLNDYEWSSYRAYVGITQDAFTEREQILSSFSEPKLYNYLAYLYAFIEKKDEVGWGK